MKRIARTLGAKIGAVVLWSVSILLSAGGAAAINCLWEMGFYGTGKVIWPYGYICPDGTLSYYESVSEGAVPAYLNLYAICVKSRYLLIGLSLAGAVMAVFVLIFLMCSAGRHPDKEEVEANGIDRIPFDVFTVILISLTAILALVHQDICWGIGPLGQIVVTGIAIIIYSLLALLFLMTAATRFKLGTVWKNTVIYRMLLGFWRMITGLGKWLFEMIREIPLIWKTVLFLAGLSLAELIVFLICFWEPDNLLLWWMIEKLILIPVVLHAALEMKKLQTGGRELAAGHLNYRVDTRHMYGNFRQHGENLNSISEGMNKAVEEKLKSERFKTELITNVSHDIKTPLTSIINYVDLIKKQNPESQTIAEYIEVLDRQSKRLKKLIEDLVEASKASTGNITVNMEPVSVGVMLTQAAGEYDDRMNSRHLELILNQPQEEVVIMADGRLLWRVFDNLLSNICKYALSGTRVYLNLDRISDKAVITFRNISAYPLNLSSDELVERFTRGDSSRHTEGSGLGLSIAKSLTELQKGELSLFTDGDLFKVVLTFDWSGQRGK